MLKAIEKIMQHWILIIHEMLIFQFTVTDML